MNHFLTLALIFVLTFAPHFVHAQSQTQTQAAVHSIDYELNLYDMKRASQQSAAIAILKKQNELSEDREEYALLVAAAPDEALSPVMKRLLLGAYFLGPTPKVRTQSVNYFIEYDAHMRQLQQNNLSRSERKKLVEQASNDLREFQTFIMGQIQNPEQSTRYLKSVARVMVSEDSEVRHWTQAILKKQIKGSRYPRYAFPRQVWARLMQFPLTLPIGMLAGAVFMKSAIDQTTVAGNTVIFFAMLVGSSLLLNDHGAPEKIKFADEELPQIINEGKTVRLKNKALARQREAMLAFIAPDCDESFEDQLTP